MSTRSVRSDVLRLPLGVQCTVMVCMPGRTLGWRSAMPKPSTFLIVVAARLVECVRRSPVTSPHGGAAGIAAEEGVAAGLAEAMPKRSQPVQIATARGTSILQLVQDLDRAFQAGGHPPIRVTFGPRRQGDVQENFADTRKALERLGWRAEVDLADGLARTVRWALGQMNEHV